MFLKIIILSIAIFLLIILRQYNVLTRSKNKVKQAKSGIDVYLNQRFDLIPNLVECVKGYVKHEKELIENIVKARSIYIKSEKNNIKQSQELNNGINKLMALSENYPQLKASEQFLNLQRNLSKMESQLQAARRIYNVEVTNYNTKIKVAPRNIIAAMFGFKEEELFKIEEYKKEEIKINFEE